MSGAATGGGYWTWPLEYNVIRRRVKNHTFGMVRNGGKRAHQGWDFEALIGTAAYAIADGKVAYIDDVDDPKGYGKAVCIRFELNGETYYAYYAHMKSFTVTPNQLVKRNTIVGYTGETGNARGMAKADQHLHFEVRLKAYCGKGLVDRVSPIKVFGRCPLLDVIRSPKASGKK
jgi:murein DD-endopeptidase MepM/ murein hydrolase activator NlpD